MLTDDQDEVTGAINAYTAFAEIYIYDLWVDNNHPNKGLGRKLIHELEEHFKGKGFNNINLVTNTFNAPEFYKKCGFELEFIRKNIKHPKLTKFFFVKFFDDEVQTQGIVQNLGS